MLLSKNRVIRRRAVVGLLLAASLTLLTLSYREGSTGVVGSMQRSALSITAPAATIAHRVTSPFVDGWHWTTGLVHARDQAAQLRAALAKLGRADATIKTLRAQNATLANAAHWVGQNPQYHSVSGSVIMENDQAMSGTITLGIGTDQGVRVNDAVVAPVGDGGGLVGLVSQVTGGQAVVKVLLDLSSAATAQIQGEAGTLGTVVPSAGNPGMLNMEQVPIAARVRRGDVVVTAGIRGNRLQSLYPAGIPIGAVTAVSRADTNGSGTTGIQVTPFADFGSLSAVVVLETH